MTDSQSEKSIAALLSWGADELARAGISEARLDAELLLGYCLGKTRTELYLSAKEKVDREPLDRFCALLVRRKKREPLAYIIGEKEFWSLPFHVSPDVLIPRPETEFLLETVLKFRNRNAAPDRLLDMCCGSGVIAVVLARELELPVIGVDISRGALEIAKKNCLRNGVESLVQLVQADLFSSFDDTLQFSLIVSNPPYVERPLLLEGLEPEVVDHEPRNALDGGDDGLNFIKAIRDRLPCMLMPGGDCFMEIGERQAENVKSLFLQYPLRDFFNDVVVFKDYSGRDRVAHIQRSQLRD